MTVQKGISKSERKKKSHGNVGSVSKGKEDLETKEGANNDKDEMEEEGGDGMRKNEREGVEEKGGSSRRRSTSSSSISTMGVFLC